MGNLSRPTVGLLAEVATALYTRTEFARLFDRCGLEYDERGSLAKDALVHQTLRRAQTKADKADARARKGLLKFVRIILEQKYDPASSWSGRISKNQLAEIREALFADGYDLRVSVTENLMPGESRPVSAQILPTDAITVPLGDEITSLEAKLSEEGYTVAATHYRQAVSNLTDHQYEAANSQLRSMLEELVIRVAVDHTGYRDSGKASQGGLAITHMLGNGLPDKDLGNALKGIWDLSHTRGSHPGKSDADEARIRMCLLTSVARLLLNHFS